MEKLLKSVADYYSDKVGRHGATPLGVDWNSAEGQVVRFSKLLDVVPPNMYAATLDDYGCGYGALLDYLRLSGSTVDYLGLDVSPRMVEEARRQHPASPTAHFAEGSKSPRVADFAVASGIFNVRLSASAEEWERHIQATLDAIDTASSRGFAFNCLSLYSDPPLRKDRLYYGDPRFYFDLCMNRYGGNVSLLHDYRLYEFTILVRKS